MSTTKNRPAPIVPSAWQIEHAIRAATEARQRILELDPHMPEDDLECYTDTLDGESGDAFEVLDRVVHAYLDAGALIEMGRAHVREIEARIKRFQTREFRMRSVAQAMLESLGLPKIERGDYTASFRKVPPKVEIIDATKLAPQFLRYKDPEPDKIAILEALKAGTKVEGAELSNPAMSLQVRV